MPGKQKEAGMLKPAHAQEERVLKMAAEIVAGYVKRNPVPSKELPLVIQSVHKTLLELSHTDGAGPVQQPAVAAEKSVTRDYIVCLEDGKKLKMLKRHLRSKYGMSPEQYRAKWNLRPDYPMVAPGYAERRSRLARDIGLGKKVSYLNRKGK